MRSVRDARLLADGCCFEVLDRLTGEITYSGKCFRIGDTPHGRRRLSKFFRSLGVDHLTADFKEAVLLPPDWELVPARGPPAGLSLDAMPGPLHRDAVQRTKSRERKFGALKYGQQIGPSGERLRFLLDSPVSDGSAPGSGRAKKAS